MRIAFFTNNYLPRTISGVARSVENFRIELEKLGHDVFVFAPKYSKNDIETDKIFRFKSIRTHSKLDVLNSIPFTLSPKIKKIIKNLDLDIIHSHHPLLIGKTALKYAKELNIPIVFTLHTPYYQYLKSLFGNFGENIGLFILEGVIKYAKQCNLVIAPTPNVKKNLVKNGLKKEKIIILPSGIEVEKFRTIDKQIARQKLGLKKNNIILLTVGRLTYERNIEFIIESFKDIAKQKKNIKLLIVGDGFSKNKLKKMVYSLHLDNRIVFTGKITYNRLSTYYRASDVFLYASLIDSQGLVLCEALASGLPIVSTNQALGPQNIIKNGKIGYLVKPNISKFNEKILNLVSNSERRDFFSKNSIKESEKYNRVKLAKKMEKMYQKLIQNANK